MKIIGVNLCQRPNGGKLLDAGVCLIEDGKIIVAIAEERLTRVKHDSSFLNSLQYCLDYARTTLQKIDMFVFSICGCRPMSKQYVQDILQRDGIWIPDEKIEICPSHHLSHAASAFFPSGLDESLVVVADRDGSILEGDECQPYENSVEHLSYYVGRGNKLTLIDRDEMFFGDIGLGKGYSYVTSWLGFDGHSHAGKTMGLAAYGNSDNLTPAHFFTYENGKIRCLLEPIETNKALAVRRLIYGATNVDVGQFGDYQKSQYAADVARLVQDDLEQVVIKKLKYLHDCTGISNLCFAGGVALNCKLNYEIHKLKMFSNIFIQPAAGDTGQCLGNALYGYHMVYGGLTRDTMKSAYLGKEYGEDVIWAAISEYQSQLNVIHYDDIYLGVAALLNKDKIVAWFQGRSEFGPRALGNRSILASPKHSEMKDTLNARVKFREYFRPFGASVIDCEARNYFDLDVESPYMLLAPKAVEQKKEFIPAVVHVDGSSRIQTVTLKENKSFYMLLREFQKLSGIPVLLNTSFNIRGEPIVETPADAIKCFVSTNIDYLVIGNCVLEKKEVKFTESGAL